MCIQDGMKALELVEQGKKLQSWKFSCNMQWILKGRCPGNRSTELGSGGLIPPLALKDPSFRKYWVSKLWEAGQFKVIGNHRPQWLILEGPSLLMGTNIPKLEFWIHLIIITSLALLHVPLSQEIYSFIYKRVLKEARMSTAVLQSK